MADAEVTRKGVDLALAALDHVLDRWPDARLALGGPGSHGWALERLGERARRVAGAVDSLGIGHQDDLPDRYRAATVSLLPSMHEAFGLLLTESLACGTPVVCSQHGGMPEIVSDPAIGRIFPPRDVQGLAAAVGAVVDLAADPRTPARCVNHARRWGWIEAVGPAHEDLYRRLVTAS
jgi:glycosyltransferase involved in cell wall biosynthesis